MSQKEVVKGVFEREPETLFTVEQLSSLTGIKDLERLRTVLSLVKKDKLIMMIDLGDSKKLWGTKRAIQLRLI